MSQHEAVVVGTGFIGPVHVEALRRAGVTVRGILASSPEKSTAAAAQLGVPTGYASFEDVIADPGVDVVHLTTPNRFHYPMALAALRAGKHVLCEKPLAMTSAESAELVRVAAETGRANAVAYNVRFYPLCHHARDLVQAGTLGDFISVTGRYVQDWLLRPDDYNWRVQGTEGGELRAVADIGTHWLDLVQFISGRRVTSICADLKTLHPVRQRPVGEVQTFTGPSERDVPTRDVAINTEDMGGLLLRFEGDARGTAWVSQTTAGRKNHLALEIAGTVGALAWTSENPNELWVGHRDQPNQTLLRDPSLLTPSAAVLAGYPGGHNEGFPDTFKQLFRAFYTHLGVGLAGPPAYPTFADGHHEILLCEAILQSHRERRWIDLP